MTYPDEPWHIPHPDPGRRALEIMDAFKKEAIASAEKGEDLWFKTEYQAENVEAILMPMQRAWIEENQFEIVGTHDVYPYDVLHIRKRGLARGV